MNTTQIVSELTAERDRLNAAIQALGGGVEVKRRGRPRRVQTPEALLVAMPTVQPSTITHRAPIAAMRRTPRTAQQRAEHSLRMKQIWAKRRQKAKKAIA